MHRYELEHFPRKADAPAPLRMTVQRTAAFSDVDPMGFVWFGRYPLYMEAAVEALNKAIGIPYSALLENGVINPVAQLGVNYLKPIHLGVTAKVTASLIWTEATKLQYEFSIHSTEGLHAVAWSANLFVDKENGDVCLADPPFFAQIRAKWLSGDFSCLQTQNG